MANALSMQPREVGYPSDNNIGNPSSGLCPLQDLLVLLLLRIGCK